MATRHDGITEPLAAFIAAQPLFFVATAGPEGRINLSPKGLDGTLAVLGPRRVAFLNMTGSGNETAAHLRLSPRITLMFCAFQGDPLIVRLYGQARAVHVGDPEWESLQGHFADLSGKRQVVVVDVTDVITSCGFAVPEMALVAQRDGLQRWAEAKGETGVRAYWRAKNTRSFDGLPTGIPGGEEE